MKLFRLLILILLASTFTFSQPITWEEQQDTGLPEGVHLFKGIRTSPKLQAFYLDIDLNREDIAIRPYHFTNPDIVTALTNKVGAYAAVNGGFFSGTTSVSSVIYPGQIIPAMNVQSVTRNEISYPVIRSLFSMDTTGQISVDWIYHFSPLLSGLYKFDQPMDYTYNDPDPQPAPVKGDGTPFPEVLLGIGGGPTLVRDSIQQITYNEEIFWGAFDYDTGQPRTAVGVRKDRHVIILVADGRQTISAGLGLPEMAQIFLSLGCVAAMNLDGGGSTQMAVGDQYVNSPSEQRSVPTILAVVHYDSLGLPREPLLEKIGDTGDSGTCQVVGSWFETANEGYWGDTKAILSNIGDGSDYVKFRPQLGVAGRYELYAWWVASNDNFRSRNCPFMIHHKNGIDTVYADQTANGSTWNRMGEWIFRGDTSDAVIVSDAAQDGPYVMADAIRLVTYDTSSATRITYEVEPGQNFRLYPNYPNPFNSGTVIRYTVGSAGSQRAVSQHVELSIYNILGQKVRTLVSDLQPAGNYAVHWEASNLPSGVYYYQLNVGSRESGVVSQTGKMVLLQ